MGVDWLHSRGGACVQELLGLPAQPPPTFSVGSVPIGERGRGEGERGELVRDEVRWSEKVRGDGTGG